MATECVKLLIERGGDALDLDVMDRFRKTALQRAVMSRPGRREIVRMLLQAGADPSIRGNGRRSRDPYDIPDALMETLLNRALIERERPRLLLKARALLDAPSAMEAASAKAREKGLSLSVHQRAVLAAVPAFLRNRVAWGEELPGVEVEESWQGGAGDGDDDAAVLACVKYALGLEGGGGWYEGEGPAPEEGMVKEVFVEFCEMLVPKWARREM